VCSILGSGGKSWSKTRRGRSGNSSWENEREAGRGGSFIAVVEHCGETYCNDFVSFMAKASFDHIDVRC
jgi:hypothetical protein